MPKPSKKVLALFEEAERIAACLLELTAEEERLRKTLEQVWRTRTAAMGRLADVAREAAVAEVAERTAAKAKPVSVPNVRIAEAVRPHHANTFVEEWFRHSWASGAMWEAFAETHLMTWPSNDKIGVHTNTPEQARYQDIEDEILARVLDAVKPAILKAFLKAATESAQPRTARTKARMIGSHER